MMPESSLLLDSENSPRAPARSRPANSRWTKLQTVSSHLEEIAVQLGPRTKLPRVSDLCVQLNASITTVNAALGELESRGILQRRPGVGIFVAPNLHQSNILLLCNYALLSRPDLSPFWSMLVQSAQARARTDALGFDLLFAEPAFESNAPGAPAVSETVARLIEANRINGAIAIDLARETVAYLERHGIAVVTFAGPGTYTVQQDAAELVRQGVRVLAKAGAKRIALWSPLQTYCPRRSSDHYTRLRLEAFHEALEEVGLPFEAALVQVNAQRAPGPDDTTDVPYTRQGYETANAVFGNESRGGVEPPDAILSTDDMFTAGSLSSLRRFGVRIRSVALDQSEKQGEKSVLFATHANAGSPVLIGYEDSLFLLEMDPADVIEALFANLEALLEGKRTVPNRTYVPCHLKLPVAEKS